MRTLRLTWPAALVRAAARRAAAPRSRPARTHDRPDRGGDDGDGAEPSTQTGGTASPAINSVTVDPGRRHDHGRLAARRCTASTPGAKEAEQLTGQLRGRHRLRQPRGALRRPGRPARLRPPAGGRAAREPRPDPLADHGDTWQKVQGSRGRLPRARDRGQADHRRQRRVAGHPGLQRRRRLVGDRGRRPRRRSTSSSTRRTRSSGRSRPSRARSVSNDGGGRGARATRRSARG